MVSLNFKSILFGISSALIMTAVMASVQRHQPAKLPIEEQQQITVASDIYKVDELDLGPYNDCKHDCHATLLTANDQYYIEVNFDYSGFDDGNGFNRAEGIQIDRLEPEKVGDEDGEINAYLDRYELVKINEALEDSIAVKLQKLGGSHG
ncbi:hypothetical protein [Acinetobacter junii]|uniref:hypothetical protein n=1 Tax=Acinetobacter junii TaxID=40215 RepID=UPI0005B38B29|nr:hypothetical protein [Acinetobacter junii]